MRRFSESSWLARYQRINQQKTDDAFANLETNNRTALDLGRMAPKVPDLSRGVRLMN
jgi:hypothetical protein